MCAKAKCTVYLTQERLVPWSSSRSHVALVVLLGKLDSPAANPSGTRMDQNALAWFWLGLFQGLHKPCLTSPADIIGCMIRSTAHLACHTWKAVRETSGTAPAASLREMLCGAKARKSSFTATYSAQVPGKAGCETVLQVQHACHRPEDPIRVLAWHHCARHLASSLSSRFSTMEASPFSVPP